MNSASQTTAQYINHAREVMDIEIAALASTRSAIGDSFQEAIVMMLAAIKGASKIVVTGVGKNLSIAEKISATLASTGSTSVALNPVQAMHGDLGIFSQGDILLALSFSGESDEIIALLPAVRRLGIPVIAITGKSASSLAKFSQVVLPIAIEREACPFNMMPSASTTATLALGDAIAVTLLKARGFNRDDYALLHPSGAIGRTLLTRVDDIMRTGTDVATVPEDSSLQDAVVAMTKAKSGCACVIDSSARLLGIFTDGDLRRNLSSGAVTLDQPLKPLMTANPKSVLSDRLAVDVLKLFEQYKIDDLPVVDGESKLVGCIDIQDLPRLKIM